jgi:hypothetical protein
VWFSQKTRVALVAAGKSASAPDVRELINFVAVVYFERRCVAANEHQREQERQKQRRAYQKFYKFLSHGRGRKNSFHMREDDIGRDVTPIILVLLRNDREKVKVKPAAASFLRKEQNKSKGLAGCLISDAHSHKVPQLT